VASFDQSLRVGRTQAALLFWGLVSLCFAAGACFYFWKSSENENRANHLRDEVLNLQSACDTLTAEKQRLQAGNADEEDQLKTRESLLQQKEDQLSAEEAHLTALAQKPATPPAAPPPPSTAEIKKFNDALGSLRPNGHSEVVPRGNSQVLRIDNAIFFDSGETALKPEGKTLLNQIAQSLKGQITGVELRIETFTDRDAESKPTPKTDANSKSQFNPWDLTAARAAALSRYFHDQDSLPSATLLIVPRGDSPSAAIPGKDAPDLNRCVEISLTPAPDPFFDPLAPPPDAPITAKTNN